MPASYNAGAINKGPILSESGEESKDHIDHPLASKTKKGLGKVERSGSANLSGFGDVTKKIKKNMKKGLKGSELEKDKDL
jgi:hypothetical protein